MVKWAPKIRSGCAGLTLALVVAPLVQACGGRTSGDFAPVDPFMQTEAQIAAQIQKYEEQLAEADRLIAVQDTQAARFDELLARWEKQAERYDRVLAGWERQLKASAPAGEVD